MSFLGVTRGELHAQRRPIRVEDAKDPLLVDIAVVRDCMAIAFAVLVEAAEGEVGPRAVSVDDIRGVTFQQGVEGDA